MQHFTRGRLKNSTLPKVARSEARRVHIVTFLYPSLQPFSWVICVGTHSNKESSVTSPGKLKGHEQVPLAQPCLSRRVFNCQSWSHCLCPTDFGIIPVSMQLMIGGDTNY